MDISLVVLFAAVSAFSATGFVVIGVMWLRRMKETVADALSETANQQIRTAQHFGDAISQLQKQQQHYDQQIQTLAQAGLRLRQEIINVSARLEPNNQDTPRGDQTFH